MTGMSSHCSRPRWWGFHHHGGGDGALRRSGVAHCEAVLAGTAVHGRRKRVSASVLALALVATACGSAGDDGDSDTGKDAPSGGTFSLQVGEPENPLVPTNTTEVGGGAIIDALWTGLVTYDPETTNQAEGHADSIESEDSKVWTIKLKDGWTFHDGTPVTADNYINAWNFGSLSTNAQNASYFFANIEGYDQMQGKDGAAPAAQKLAGLKKIDDLTFEVTLKDPFRQYPLTLGYSAFYPVPKSFFGADGVPGGSDDKAAQDAFGKKPIGNGPFQASENFSPEKGITLSRYDDYPMEKAEADSVEFRVYSDIKTAYTDLQGDNLDFTEVPASEIKTYRDQFPENSLSRETSTFSFLAMPGYDARFDDPRVRQAFSMALDREAINKAIFDGARPPAKSVISPVVNGHRPDACEFCEFKPEEAKKLLAQTDFDTKKPVDLWLPAGGDELDWMQAVGNQLRDNLGITYKLRAGLDFAEYLPKIDEKGMSGPFALGWAMDYPSPQNYLEPLYSTQALPPNGSNVAFYSNPTFDELVAEGNRAQTNEDAVEKYQEAEDVLLQDLPVLPLFFSTAQYVWSDKLDNVKVNAFSNLVLEDVTVEQ